MGFLNWFREWKNLNKKIARSFNRIYQRIIILEKEKISKEEAMQIMKQAEDEGLVHKAFHNNLDVEKEIELLPW
ncbi:hypothetical protein ES703_94514 [subsurface metagenome]